MSHATERVPLVLLLAALVFFIVGVATQRETFMLGERKNHQNLDKAELLLRTGQHKEAREAFIQAFIIGEDAKECAAGVGECSFALFRRNSISAESFRTDLEFVAERDPARAEYYRGCAAELAANTDKAKQHFAKAAADGDVRAAQHLAKLTKRGK